MRLRLVRPGDAPEGGGERAPHDPFARHVAAIVDARLRLSSIVEETSETPRLELERTQAQLVAAIDELCAWAPSPEASEDVRATIAQLVRAYREQTFWNRHPDDPDDFTDAPLEYDAPEVFCEVLADLCWAAGLERRARKMEERTGAHGRVRAPRDGEVAERASVMRSLLDLLGAAPWSEPSTEARLAAAHRLSVMGSSLRELARGMSSDDANRPAVRRVARAAWALDHVRLVEAAAVWRELDEAVAALERALVQ